MDYDLTDPLFERALSGPSSFVPNLLRFCLSDHLPINIASVLTGSLDPVTYAAKLASENTDVIADKFFTDVPGCHDYPYVLKQAWAYDNLISIAAYLRLAKLFPGDEVKQQNIFNLANIYVLNAYDRHYLISAYGGLCDFVYRAKSHMVTNPLPFKAKDAIFLNQLLANISTIDQPDWLFWNPIWQGITTNPHKARVLRQFFHVAFTAFVMPPDNVMQCYDLSVDDIVTLIYDFVELTSNPAATKKDVEAFLKRLNIYFLVSTINPGMNLLLEAPFEIVNVYYVECQGNVAAFEHHMGQATSGFN